MAFKTLKAVATYVEDMGYDWTCDDSHSSGTDEAHKNVFTHSAAIVVIPVFTGNA